MDSIEAAWRVEQEMFGKIAQHIVARFVEAQPGGKLDLKAYEYFRTLTTAAEE